MNIRRHILNAAAGCLAGMLIAVMGPLSAQEPAGPRTASMLWYQEKEAGTDIYPVRIIVSAGFVRIDDDDDGGDFVLLDRATRTLYSVNHEERNILVIEYQPREPRVPDTIRFDEVIEEDAAMPAVAGKQPLLVRFTANDTTCYRVAAVPGLLDDAVAGLADYARVLGNRQLGSLHTVPAEMQTPCFLSRYVYAPDRHLRHGLPIQEWDGAGYQRSLVNFRAGAQVEPGLFALPEGYQHIRLATD
ncbi:MAG TPA: hypothetical protein VM011_10735 [Gammaproteobacteria bacterium]|nr:hypothetical protein [Gammaproteobacteria bacterium]